MTTGEPMMVWTSTGFVLKIEFGPTLTVVICGPANCLYIKGLQHRGLYRRAAAPAHVTLTSTFLYCSWPAAAVLGTGEIVYRMA